jgi:hypothetical protein
MASKTLYPGMQNAPVQEVDVPSNSGRSMTMFPGMPQEGVQASKEGKPIMGFLFSVSKTPFGEFWPLYVGQNTIGRGANNSICLKEASVSDAHATLTIRKMQKNGESNGVCVFVQDTGSTCGTMLNGETLDFNPRECANGSVITVGANYELYLLLVDADALGLQTKEEFKSIESKPGFVPGQWAGQNVAPANSLNEGAKGTMPGNGQSPFDGRRPTIYMPERK